MERSIQREVQFWHMHGQRQAAERVGEPIIRYCKAHRRYQMHEVQYAQGNHIGMIGRRGTGKTLRDAYADLERGRRVARAQDLGI